MVVKKSLEKKSDPKISVDKLIDKGAKVKEDNTELARKWTNLNLRITKDILDTIDAILENRIGISRTGWILEAIQEKLKRTELE